MKKVRARSMPQSQNRDVTQSIIIVDPNNITSITKMRKEKKKVLALPPRPQIRRGCKLNISYIENEADILGQEYFE